MADVHPPRQNACPDCGASKQRKAKRCRECYDKQHRVPKNICECGSAISSKAKRCWPCRIEASRAQAKKISSSVGKLRYHHLQLLETENLALVESTLREISVKCTLCDNSYVFDRDADETWACVHCDRLKVQAFKVMCKSRKS